MIASNQATWSGFDREEDDEDGIFTDEAETQWSNKDSILFVIDCSKSMLEPSKDEEVPFISAMKCAQSVLMSKIVSSETDHVGILLYGTEKGRNSTDFKHIYILQDLDIPDARRIKEVEAIVEGTIKFDEEFGSTAEEFPLGNVFWTCSNMFSATAQKTGSKRVFLITNEDNPHANNPVLRNAAKTRVRDLAEVGIRLELFNVDKPEPEAPFNLNTFYKEVIQFGGENDDDDDDAEPLELPNASRKFEELMTRIRRKEVKKRTQFKIPFHIADGFTIGVKGYTLIMEQKKGSYKLVYMKGARVKEVETVTGWICSDTTQFLQPEEMKYSYNYGGEKVVFAREEMEKLRNFGEIGLTLIGFKPREALRIDFNIKHPYFIYPDENAYTGSTRVFAALLKKMTEMNKIALCSMINRNNALPRLVALLPQPEALDENNAQERPPGFHIIILPYADDIREIPVEDTQSAKDEHINAMLAIVEKLMIKGGYKPETYENPALQRHYGSLQALALEHDVEENIEDKSLPRTDAIHNRVGAKAALFNELLAETAPAPVSKGVKRTKDDAGGDTAKRAKTVPKGASANDIDMKAMWASGELHKCTVSVLKTWLESVGRFPKGKKQDLIDMIEDYFKSN